MTDQSPQTTEIPTAVFVSSLVTILDELFSSEDAQDNYVLDKGTSMFSTLATIDAATASKQYSPRCSNLAAQVNHTRFYLDTVMDGMRNGWQQVDWDASWQIGDVTAAEWQELIARLQSTYTELRTFAASNTSWSPPMVGGAFAIVAHNAYHLGEIRQALAILQIPE
jgi:hypothetical protein